MEILQKGRKKEFFNKSCGNPYTPSVCFADTFPILPYGKTGQAFGRKKGAVKKVSRVILRSEATKDL